MSVSLNSRVVLVTRPRHQAQGFISRIEHLGGQAVAFPTIEIESLTLNSEQRAIISSLDEYDLLLFISANAVRIARERLQQEGVEPVTLHNQIAAIGKATAAAAMAAGFTVSVESESGFDSESLLTHRAMQPASISGKRVLIIKGEGGRDMLQKTLEQRGASVTNLVLYRRRVPPQDVGLNRQQLSRNWRTLGINSITVTSNAALQNLYDMLEQPGRNEILGVELIVPSSRAVELARQLGFRQIRQAESAHDDHMLQALLAETDN